MATANCSNDGAIDGAPACKRPRSTDPEELVDLDDEFGFAVEAEPFSKGAEANLTRCLYLGKKGIRKVRIHKSYRHPDLDVRLIKDRMRSEVRGIFKCKCIGVPVPTIYFINEENNEVILEEIPGRTLREHLLEKEYSLTSDAYQAHFSEVAFHIGKVLAKMHLGGLIHGDLTSANIMMRNGVIDDLVLLDFGLSYQKNIPEDKAVDIYVFERALAALHDGLDATTFEAIRKGYESVNSFHGGIIYKKLEEVRLRGRKRDMVG